MAFPTDRKKRCSFAHFMRTSVIRIHILTYRDTKIYASLTGSTIFTNEFLMSNTLRSTAPLAIPLALHHRLLEWQELSVNELQEVTRLGQSAHFDPSRFASRGRLLQSAL